MAKDKNDKKTEVQKELKELYNESYVDTSKRVSTKAFLELYKQCGGNANKACRLLGISYSVYVRMKKNNPEAFEEADKNLRDKEKAFVYNKLLQLVAQGNVVATIFACKSLCGLKEASTVTIESPSIDVEAAIKELKDRILED